MLCTFLEQFHNKVANQQVLCLCHELSIRATGFKSRFPSKIRQHIGSINQRKFAHLILADRFADYHSRVHENYFLGGCFATSRSFTLSYCSLVKSCLETKSDLLRKGR